MPDVMFLPGIIAPAAFRYAVLLETLPKDVNPILKDLEVYDDDSPPPSYSIDTEVSGIDRAADKAGLDRFHIYAHSGGGACALAYVAAHPDRVITLAVDEPATDFTQEDQNDPYQEEIKAAAKLPEPESTLTFLRLQLADGVEIPPALTSGHAPEWMANRPAGIKAFVNAIFQFRVPASAYERFPAPVLFTYGTLSHPRWITMRDRLARLFPDFRAEEFEGVHHLFTSHQAEPARTAALLRDFWGQADSWGLP
jgi:pimeloyl-ACP methyl ester carboxylesterase